MGEKNGEKIREKKAKKTREIKYGEKKYRKIRGKSKGKSHVTSGDVTSGQAQWSDPLDPKKY